jgi:hypothetical protein
MGVGNIRYHLVLIDICLYTPIVLMIDYAWPYPRPNGSSYEETCHLSRLMMMLETAEMR